MTTKKIPSIIEVTDWQTANEIFDTGFYRSPEYDKNKSAYIFIKKVKKEKKE